MAHKKKSGLKSSIDPQREQFTDIRAKLLHCSGRKSRPNEWN